MYESGLNDVIFKVHPRMLEGLDANEEINWHILFRRAYPNTVKMLSTGSAIQIDRKTQPKQLKGQRLYYVQLLIN